MSFRTIFNEEFNNILRSPKDDFKTIINKNINRKTNGSDFAVQCIRTKCAMDFYEDMNREMARDSKAV